MAARDIEQHIQYAPKNSHDRLVPTTSGGRGLLAILSLPGPLVASKASVLWGLMHGAERATQDRREFQEYVLYETCFVSSSSEEMIDAARVRFRASLPCRGCKQRIQAAGLARTGRRAIGCRRTPRRSREGSLHTLLRGSFQIPFVPRAGKRCSRPTRPLFDSIILSLRYLGASSNGLRTIRTRRPDQRPSGELGKTHA